MITKCLGELAAIDPTRVRVLQITNNQVIQLSILYSSGDAFAAITQEIMPPKELAVSLIEFHLVNLVRGARHRTDQVAYHTVRM